MQEPTEDLSVSDANSAWLAQVWPASAVARLCRSAASVLLADAAMPARCAYPACLSSHLAACSPTAAFPPTASLPALIPQKYTLQPGYAAALQQAFGAHVAPLTTAAAVNAWVAEATKGKISGIVDEGTVSQVPQTCACCCSRVAAFLCQCTAVQLCRSPAAPLGVPRHCACRG